MLTEGRKAALRLPSAPLPPGEGLRHPAQPPPAALPGTARMSPPAPPQPPWLGIPAAPALPQFPSQGGKNSPSRSPRRLRQGPPPPVRVGNLGDSERGGPAALRPLHRPARCHPTSNTSTTSQELLKPGLGHQLGHAPSPERDQKVLLSSRDQTIRQNKLMKSTEKVCVPKYAGGLAVLAGAAFSSCSWCCTHRFLSLLLEEHHGASPSGLPQPLCPALTITAPGPVLSGRVSAQRDRVHLFLLVVSTSCFEMDCIRVSTDAMKSRS